MSQTPPAPRISLTVSPRPGSRGGVAGTVVIANVGGADVRVWRPANSWGDQALQFEIDAAAGVQHIRRQILDYTRNTPAAETIAPGGAYRIDFDLDDGSWTASPAFGSGGALAAVLEIADSAEARVHGVWIGRVRSPSVALTAP